MQGRKEEGGKRPFHFGVALPYLGIIEQMQYGAYGVLWLWMGWDGQLQPAMGIIDTVSYSGYRYGKGDGWMDGWIASLAEYIPTA